MLLFDKVIVAGHSGCGGVSACISAARAQSSSDPEKHTVTLPGSSGLDAPLKRWLDPLTKLTISLGLSNKTKEEALPIVVHANIKEQVRKLAETEIIRRAWENGKSVQIHGWLYELETGGLHDLGISQGNGIIHHD